MREAALARCSRNSVYTGSRPVCAALLQRLNERHASDTGRPSHSLGTTDVSRRGTEDSVVSRPQGCKSYLG